MELQFQKQSVSCLQMLLHQTQLQEQTQEVRISDGMPDMGNVLSAWGQIILRTKQWQDNTAQVSGGVMAWVLYIPEEGGAPCQVESWIPFQLRWELPQTDRDGVLLTNCLLRSVDARITSARKLMLRANVAVTLSAMVSGEKTYCVPGELPPDIRLKKVTYPVTVPAEAGEKAFTLEDTQPLSQGSTAEKILRYSLQPEVLEKKVMADKIVFRGTARLQLLCMGADEEYFSKSVELPFSQYAQLTGEYPENADCTIVPCVTALEAEIIDAEVKVKAGITCQYIINKGMLLELTEDAYSPVREVALQCCPLELPLILDSREQKLSVTGDIDVQGQQIADVSFLPGVAEWEEEEDDKVRLIQPGLFQLLYYDEMGQLQSLTRRAQQTLELPMDDGDGLLLTTQSAGIPTGRLAPEGMLQADVLLQLCVTAGEDMHMVCALEIGEETAPDPDRPSLIVKRAGSQSLWDMAKAAGSTQEAIMKANSLTAEAQEGQIILIPVM